MALLDASSLNDIQISDAQNDKRFSELGIINAVKESDRFVDFIPESARKQMQELSSDRDLQIPVIIDQTVEVNTTPGFNFIPSNLPESAQFTFTAVDVFSGFRHYDAQFANNSLESERVKQMVMKNVLFEMGNTIETLLSTTLDTRRSQVLDFTTQINQGTGGGTYTFDGGADVLNINLAAQQKTMFANLTEVMAANELGGNYRVVTNRAGLAVQKTEALQFGAANNNNLQALGMFSADEMHESGNIAAGSDVFNGFLIRDGAIGLVENFPFDFRTGKTVDSRRWSVSDQELPFLRMRANIYTNTEATDATALVASGTDSNLKMTTFQEMAIWSRFYIVFRFNSDISTRAQDIVKLSGKTS